MNDIERQAKDYVVRERSDYQLLHFVVGQHDTLQMQYRQILLEVKSLITKIRLAELATQKQRIKLDRLSGSALNLLKAEKIRINMVVTLDAIEGARRELNYLLELAGKYPQYTPQEIEENQEEYWESRLQRQANLDRMSVEQNVSAGNLASMLNAGLLNRSIEK